jgi:hypothetical protein
LTLALGGSLTKLPFPLDSFDLAPVGIQRSTRAGDSEVHLPRANIGECT